MRKKSSATKKKNDAQIERDDLPRITITVTDESVYLTKHDRRTGAPGVTYPVASASVASAFNMFGANTGLLSQNVLFWQSKGGLTRIGWWIEPSVHTLLIRRKTLETYKVPLPGFVFIGMGLDYYIFAANERPTRDADRLYHCPLPNVYPGGKICTGNVPFPKCEMRTIEDAVRLFFESEFNNDLAGQDTNELLKSLHGKRVFPNEKLRTVEGTIGEMVSGDRSDRQYDWDEHGGPDDLDPYEYAYGETEEDDED